MDHINSSTGSSLHYMTRRYFSHNEISTIHHTRHNFGSMAEVTESKRLQLRHSQKLLQLRAEWYARELMQHTVMMNSSRTEDSGLGFSPADDDSLHHDYNSRLHQRASTDLGRPGSSSEYDIDTIKHEAEVSQHMVEMISSTNTMRQRKEVYADLTYRRRGVKAKQQLSSYAPKAPKAAKWGLMFDSIMAGIRGENAPNMCEHVNDGSENNPSFREEAECDQGLATPPWSEYDQPCGTASEVVADRLVAVDDHVDYFRSDDFGCTDFRENHSLSSDDFTLTDVSENYCSQDSLSQRQSSFSMGCVDRPPAHNQMAEDSATFWEENWISPVQSADDNVVEEEACSICSVDEQISAAESEHRVPSLCYKNNKCHISEASHPSLYSKSTLQHTHSDYHVELASILVRRPDLAMYRIPPAPIRKTDSSTYDKPSPNFSLTHHTDTLIPCPDIVDNLVWVERNECEEEKSIGTPLRKTGKASTWSRLKRWLGISVMPEVH